MKILGIGIDLINNKRISVLKKKKSFMKRIFTDNEIKLSKKKVNETNFLAKRFAAKEAFVKTLGTGFRDKLNFRDIEIVNNKIGKPYFLKSKKINNIIFKRFNIKKYDLFLSISDEKDYSIAFSILQKK